MSEVSVGLDKANRLISDVPDTHIHICGKQPLSMDYPAADRRHKEQAVLLYDALCGSLPGGTLTALVGLLMAGMGSALLRVPVDLPGFAVVVPAAPPAAPPQ